MQRMLYFQRRVQNFFSSEGAYFRPLNLNWGITDKSGDRKVYYIQNRVLFWCLLPMRAFFISKLFQISNQGHIQRGDMPSDLILLGAFAPTLESGHASAYYIEISRLCQLLTCRIAFRRVRRTSQNLFPCFSLQVQSPLKPRDFLFLQGIIFKKT